MSQRRKIKGAKDFSGKKGDEHDKEGTLPEKRINGLLLFLSHPEALSRQNKQSE